MPNPFFALLLAASTLFVVTCFAYLMSPTVLEQAGGKPPGPSLNLARWLDRNAPYALGGEFLVMLFAGALAVTTDRWFPEKSSRPVKPPGP